MTLIYHILTDVTYQAYRTLKINYIFTLILYNYYHHSLDDFRKRRGDNQVSPRERFVTVVLPMSRSWEDEQVSARPSVG